MRVTDTHLYFYSRSVFSNFHPTEFVDPILQREFKTSEQHFMFYKADFFRDTNIASTILNAQDPAQAKVFGRQVKGFQKPLWDIVSPAFMEYAVYLKFTQNIEAKKELLATGDNRILVEASTTDLIWGVGLDERDDDILDEAKWKGQNLLGKALMKVRAMIVQEEKVKNELVRASKSMSAAI